MVHYLTAEEVLFLHSRLISESGGSQGIRDLGLLLSALGRPRATFLGKDLYPDVYKKAAALFDSLVRNHPFIDENKRTAIVTAILFLNRNKIQLHATHAEIIRFTLVCAQSRLSFEETTDWFKKNCS